MKVYNCPNCGAILHIGNKKVIECEYCNSEIHISNLEIEVVEREKEPKYDIEDFKIYDIQRDFGNLTYIALLMEIPMTQFNAELQDRKMFRICFEIDRYDEIHILNAPKEFREKELRNEIIKYCVTNGLFRK